MSKTMKTWLIVAASLVVIGLIAFAVIMTINDWDFTKLGTGKFETSTYELNEEFCNISIKTDTADIVFVPSDDEKCKVVCYEAENVKHSVSVADGVLTVNVVDTRKWYEYIGINFGAPKITIYLPEAEYASLIIEERTGDIEISNDFKFESIDVSVSTGDVKCYASAAEAIKIAASTGDISVADISVDLLELSISTGNVTVSGVTCEGDVKVGVSTGKVSLSDIVCQSVISSGSTGDIFLKNVIAAEKFSIKRSTGCVKFDGSDAAEIFVETDTGDVEGSLLTDKVFITKTDTGDISVPSSITGGRCEITTDTGDIKITIN
ncbi:MAG: DUF4097 family beta strand repeat protein [Clostridia bacterium]|nr:DUF4097 family beta strand repeat protein [Clostridia bacterium]